MPSLQDVINAVRDAADQEPDTMVTLTLSADDTKWLQILPDKINLAYPYENPPLEQLTAFGIANIEIAAVGFFEPGLFADFDTSAMSVQQMSEFLTAYLATAFGTVDLDEYSVSFDVAERGTIVANSDHEFLRKIVQLKRYFEGRSPRKP